MSTETEGVTSVDELRRRYYRSRLFTLMCAATHVGLAWLADNMIFLGFTAFFLGCWVESCGQHQMVLAHREVMTTQRALLEDAARIIARFTATEECTLVSPDDSAHTRSSGR